MKKTNEQIDLIDTLLKNDDALNVYINDIELSNIKTPDNLENNILKFINSKNDFKQKENSQTKRFKAVDILKIAACTILSLLLWKAMAIQPGNIPENPDEVEQKTYFTINSSDFYRKINKFMFKPINLERGEK